MPKIASIFRSVVSAAALAAVLAAGPALSAEPLAAAEPTGAKAAPAAELKCHDQAVNGRGLGFLPSKTESEEAAKKAWLPKAQAIFADASWETAQNAKFMCAKQGLYSNCTASAIPCGTEPGAPAEAKGN